MTTLFSTECIQAMSNDQKKSFELFQSSGCIEGRHAAWRHIPFSVSDQSTMPCSFMSFDAALNEWKQTKNVRYCIIFRNGQYQPNHSVIPQEGIDIVSQPYRDDMIHAHDDNDAMMRRYPLIALNHALRQSQTTMNVHHYDANEPLYIASFYDDRHDTMASDTRIVIIHSAVMLPLVEEAFILSPLTCCHRFTKIVLHPHASCERLVTQTHDGHGKLMCHEQIQLSEQSHCVDHYIHQSNQSERIEKCITLGGKQSCYTVNANQSAIHDCQTCQFVVDVNHVAPDCESHINYRSVSDHRSQLAFSARVYVDDMANGTQSAQGAKHLLLSEKADVSTKPELEIYAKDVKCRHGASVGELDDESLFYLMARGISRDDAKKILIHGFQASLLNQIRHDGLRHIANEAVTYD